MKNKIKEIACCLAMSLVGTIVLFLPESGLADENGGWSYSFTPFMDGSLWPLAVSIKGKETGWLAKS